MRFLTIEQGEELRTAIQYPYGVLVAVLAYGGIRWSEAAALRLRRVDILRSRLTIAEAVTQVGARFFWGVPKNHRHREIAIPADLRDDLNEHILAGLIIEPEELIFTSPHGQTLRSSNFHRSVWKPALRGADIDSQLRIHDLRHTCAAVMISAGAHPEVIKRHLGHSSIKVTMDSYGHLFPSDADALAGRINSAISKARADSRRTEDQGSAEATAS